MPYLSGTMLSMNCRRRYYARIPLYHDSQQRLIGMVATELEDKDTAAAWLLVHQAFQVPSLHNPMLARHPRLLERDRQRDGEKDSSLFVCLCVCAR